MAKQVVWTITARRQRQDILEYWSKRNGNKKYSQKISRIIRGRIKYIVKFNYIGKETDFQNIRVTAAGYFSIFYQIKSDQIVVVCFWDNRQNPGKLEQIIKQPF
ncbi:MAG: type II toxin-antitoxin system RelE/ParE family toxin [Chlorobi bacterium]|nr:type II toxin-antitoxin system RelE/ParE family toxin [Chlorobiota bacterium]